MQILCSYISQGSVATHMSISDYMLYLYTMSQQRKSHTPVDIFTKY